MKVKKGDTVLVIAGKDKGARGKVIQAYPARDRVLVEGVNRIKKHTRVSQNQRGAQSGGIVTQEAAIHVSNVMVIDSDGKPTRVGRTVVETEDGKNKRVRISRKSGKEI
jgi:large subunit ribosomal protein L24